MIYYGIGHNDIIDFLLMNSVILMHISVYFYVIWPSEPVKDAMNVFLSQFAAIVILLIVSGTYSFHQHNHQCFTIHRAIPTSIRSAPPPVAAVELNNNPLAQFLGDLAAVGPVRFVVVGNGAILETVGRWSNLRYADTPKGRLATVSTDEPCFECHLRLGEVKEVKNISVEKFGKLLRITRFLGADGSTLLSSILHGGTADVDPQYVNAW